MVSTEKTPNAIQIIQRLIIYARKMAYEKDSHEKIASLLDDIEYLPGLLNSPEDETERFREYVAGIDKKHGWKGLLDMFDK